MGPTSEGMEEILWWVPSVRLYPGWWQAAATTQTQFCSPSDLRIKARLRDRGVSSQTWPRFGGVFVSAPSKRSRRHRAALRSTRHRMPRDNGTVGFGWRTSRMRPRLHGSASLRASSCSLTARATGRTLRPMSAATTVAVSIDPGPRSFEPSGRERGADSRLRSAKAQHYQNSAKVVR